MFSHLTSYLHASAFDHHTGGRSPQIHCSYIIPLALGSRLTMDLRCLTAAFLHARSLSQCSALHFVFWHGILACLRIVSTALYIFPFSSRLSSLPSSLPLGHALLVRAPHHLMRFSPCVILLSPLLIILTHDANHSHSTHVYSNNQPVLSRPLACHSHARLSPS